MNMQHAAITAGLGEEVQGGKINNVQMRVGAHAKDGESDYCLEIDCEEVNYKVYSCGDFLFRVVPRRADHNPVAPLANAINRVNQIKQEQLLSPPGSKSQTKRKGIQKNIIQEQVQHNPSPLFQLAGSKKKIVTKKNKKSPKMKINNDGTCEGSIPSTLKKQRIPKKESNILLKKKKSTRPCNGQGKQTNKICSVETCTRQGKGRLRETPDEFGPPGWRCVGHGGGYYCSIPGCGKSSQGKTRVDDELGPAGQRCFRHGGGYTRCQVQGCRNSSVAQTNGDIFGNGRRCEEHLNLPSLQIPAIKQEQTGNAPIAPSNTSTVLNEQPGKKKRGRKSPLSANVSAGTPQKRKESSSTEATPKPKKQRTAQVKEEPTEVKEEPTEEKVSSPIGQTEVKKDTPTASVDTITPPTTDPTPPSDQQTPSIVSENPTGQESNTLFPPHIGLEGNVLSSHNGQDNAASSSTVAPSATESSDGTMNLNPITIQPAVEPAQDVVQQFYLFDAVAEAA